MAAALEMMSRTPTASIRSKSPLSQKRKEMDATRCVASIAAHQKPTSGGVGWPCQSRGEPLAFQVSRITMNGMNRNMIGMKNQATDRPGEPISPSSRLAALVDYANLIGMDDHPGDVSMINPDVTAHFLRHPRSEWIAITGDTRFDAGLGRGLSMAHLSDTDGVFAVATTSQLIQPREP